MTISSCPAREALSEIATGRNTAGQRIDFRADIAAAALSAPCPLKAENERLRSEVHLTMLEMAKARRRASDVEDEALLAECFIHHEEGLLLRVW